MSRKKSPTQPPPTTSSKPERLTVAQRRSALSHDVINKRNAAIVAMQVANKDLNGDTPAWAWAAIAAHERAEAVDLQVAEILRLLQERPRPRRK